MSNRIYDNKDNLKEFHYIRVARSSNNYWFSWYKKTLLKYKNKYKDNFCLVIIGSSTDNNNYILPYSEIKNILSKTPTYNSEHWIGSIHDDIMYIRNSDQKIDVSGYFNAFHLLNRKIILLKKFTNILINSCLKDKIKEFNEQYKNISFHENIVMSEQIDRPGIVVEHLKKLNKYTCQICKEKGFLKSNGIPYIEAHHIYELHKLIPGSYCTDNIITVCPTCHRKLHYANVKYKIQNNKISVFLEINGKKYKFKRNIKFCK